MLSFTDSAEVHHISIAGGQLLEEVRSCPPPPPLLLSAAPAATTASVALPLLLEVALLSPLPPLPLCMVRNVGVSGRQVVEEQPATAGLALPAGAARGLLLPSPAPLPLPAAWVSDQKEEHMQARRCVAF